MGCVGEYHSPGTSPWQPAFLDRPDGSPVTRIKDVEDRLLGRLRQRLDRLAIHGDIDQHRRARNIHVPHAVMHQLVMPLPLAGFQIHRTMLSPKRPLPGRWPP